MKKSMILMVSTLILFSCSQGNGSSEAETSSDQTESNEQVEMTEEDQLKAAVEADPNNAAANYNLAIFYYNQGVDLIRNMSTPEEAGSDSLTFNKMMNTQQRIEALFRKALPYAEAAHRIDSANAQAITMLSGIHFGLNDMKKSDEYNAMLGDSTHHSTHTYDAI